MIKIKSYSATSDQGPHLEINEDLVHVDTKHNLFILMDGFGGSGIGDVACKNVLDNIKAFYNKISMDPDSTMPFYYGPQHLLEGNALINAVKSAHSHLWNSNEKVSIKQRAGISILAMVLSGNILSYLSYGNCVCFLLRNGNINFLNLPDTLHHLELHHYNKSLQTFPNRCLGLFAEIQFELKEIKLYEGDLLCLMSDGVYSRLSSEEIKYNLFDSGVGLQTRSQHLLKIANDRGNLDNQSIVLIQF